jgi:mRNA interferase HigB
VRILGRGTLEKFAKRHASARKSLAHWEKAVKAASWKNFADMRGTFRSADLVGGKTVFNIGGNNFRLIALVDFKAKTVLITDVLTHAEYDQQRWK